MAQITYTNKVALNVNPNVPDINKVVDSDMNQIKEVVNQNENKYLLAVSSSAPAQCSTGDVYFNTTTNLLYTATATNTWSNTGIAPTSNTLYIVIETQTTYTYNGTTLVSVGGGSGSSDIVMVYPDTPTEDTKLYIEEGDLDFQGLEIATSYNNANNMAYSCDYVNGALTYSTDEVNTHKKWIDGKEIYRKTIQLTANTTTQSFPVSTLSSNISEIWIDMETSHYAGGGIISDWEVSGGRFKIVIDSGNIYYVCSSSLYANATITFEYTKTTTNNTRKGGNEEPVEKGDER